MPTDTALKNEEAVLFQQVSPQTAQNRIMILIELCPRLETRNLLNTVLQYYILN